MKILDGSVITHTIGGIGIHLVLGGPSYLIDLILSHRAARYPFRR
jgi:hypothetical protein